MHSCNLRNLLFLTLCCDLGLFTKRLVAPAANLITDAMHIPGGIGTSFSLMFLVVAALLMPGKGWGYGALMGTVQSIIALSLGMVGSMGILSPIGYILPGVVIDLVVVISRHFDWEQSSTAITANMAAAAAASLTANLIVFHLWGVVLMLYMAVALLSGFLCGYLASSLVVRLRRVLGVALERKENHL